MDNADARLRKRERLRKRKEFLEVYAKGERFPGRLFFIFLLRNQLPVSRLGLTVSRKAGKPVLRSRLKRRLREIFRRNKRQVIPFSDLVINARRSATRATYRALEEEFLGAMAAWREKWSVGAHDVLDT